MFNKIKERMHYNGNHRAWPYVIRRIPTDFITKVEMSEISTIIMWSTYGKWEL